MTLVTYKKNPSIFIVRGKKRFTYNSDTRHEIVIRFQSFGTFHVMLVCKVILNLFFGLDMQCTVVIGLGNLVTDKIH